MMADITGFLKIKRKDAGNRPINERICDFSEVEQVLNSEDRCFRHRDAWIAVFLSATGAALLIILFLSGMIFFIKETGKAAYERLACHK